MVPPCCARKVGRGPMDRVPATRPTRNTNGLLIHPRQLRRNPYRCRPTLRSRNTTTWRSTSSPQSVNPCPASIPHASRAQANSGQPTQTLKACSATGSTSFHSTRMVRRLCLRLPIVLRRHFRSCPLVCGPRRGVSSPRPNLRPQQDPPGSSGDAEQRLRRPVHHRPHVWTADHIPAVLRQWSAPVDTARRWQLVEHFAVDQFAGESVEGNCRGTDAGDTPAGNGCSPHRSSAGLVLSR